ncbi:MAG: ATP-grasp domain-containing protein, partial [Gammaproteobacteria bacterium]|nr:ATP-grasp domain-containing protein [Gammaproteobacteria bacterium]
AGALFSMAAVNDRITRFVRDHDLPVIVFGYGDCTGGAQASFVTHPLVQTYYLSGASMPFAGQIVVPSNLPLNSILANYLSTSPEAMQGLVAHPFQPELDNELRRVDPDIPLPKESVDAVIRRVLSGVLDQEAPEAAPPPRYTDADLIRPIKRLLIHARGCTAAKLVRVAQRHRLEVILVQSDPDMESAVADQLGKRDTLVCIGGNTPDESYLNARSVLSIAEQERADALHPGIGFLSESAQFAELTRSRGLNFIGPPVASMETMGNKSNAINTALRLGVPVVPGSHGILTDAERAAEVAEEIGFPVLIKAVHGGGGKGIQVVESSTEFFELFHRVTAEAQSAFGNGDVYLEKYVTSLRHIEVQLLRDTLGNTLVLGLRDCSVQRDKQKVFEESGSTMLPEDLRRDVLTYSAAIADDVGYVGAGTVEFIFDLAAGAVYFMEMNTRLQVEHPVTEWVSGIDIVGEQFRIAAGESIAELEPKFEGYAIEARINAERVQLDGEGALSFRPHPGTIDEAQFPVEKDVDVITIAAPGKFISPYYDSMVAQVIVHAKDRQAAIERLADYLAQVRITGICTNIPLLRRVLADELFREGDYDTGFLPEFLQRTDTQGLIEEIEAGAGESASAFDVESIGIDGSDELKVLSPAAAIFYTAPSPSEPEFVSVGDRIAVDATLCQLEAMKIFTPLALKDFNGEADLYDPSLQFEVTRINMGNGQQVNAGDLLFVVRPLSAA